MCLFWVVPRNHCDVKNVNDVFLCDSRRLERTLAASSCPRSKPEAEIETDAKTVRSTLGLFPSMASDREGIALSDGGFDAIVMVADATKHDLDISFDLCLPDAGRPRMTSGTGIAALSLMTGRSKFFSCAKIKCFWLFGSTENDRL
jgi:hypothetical protein